MTNMSKLGHTLAFLVHEKHLSIMGLEMMADAFNIRQLQELGRHIEDARAILETATRARRVRVNLHKFTGESDDDPAYYT